MPNEIEWVLESDWSKVNVGDRVRVERAEFSAEGVLDEMGRELWLGPVRIGSFEKNKWTLYVAPKPTPALPTEPGIYQDPVRDIWELDDRGWALVGVPGYTRPDVLPLIRLESQADTAEKVLEKVAELWDQRPFDNLREISSAVAAEFGVSL